MSVNVSLLYATIITARHSTAMHACVLTSTPGHPPVSGDMREMATRLGVTVHDIRMPVIEYHTGALMEIGHEIEQAVAKGPTVFVLDEADAAAPGVLEGVIRLFPARKAERDSITVIASIRDKRDAEAIAGKLAHGLGIDVGRVMHADPNKDPIEDAALATPEI